MKIVDNYGDIIITDEGPPRTYPAGCQGTSICDFFEYYEKTSYGIGIVKAGKPYSGDYEVYNKNPNGYWLRKGRKPEDYILELKRKLRKEKIKKINGELE